MIARRRGKVVNVASVLGARGLPGYAAYSASKGGLLALTRALAVEWARHNVQVNAIAPGWFVTPMNEEAFARRTRIRDRLLRDVPARRTGARRSSALWSSTWRRRRRTTSRERSSSWTAASRAG